MKALSGWRRLMVQGVMDISTVAHLTGLRPVTIRSWERRYGVVVPRRDTAGRRAYSDGDVERLCLLAMLVRRGRRIGSIVSLDLEALHREVGRFGSPAHGPGLDLLPRHVIEAVKGYDIPACTAMIGNAIVALGPLEAVEQVLSPLMRLVGEEWARGRIDLPQEHAITGVVTGLLMSSLGQLQHVARADRLVIATLGGDAHELGCLFAAYVAASRGVRCINLGSGVPTEALIAAVRESRARAVALSLVQRRPGTRVALDRVCEAFAGSMPIWLGGEAAMALHHEGNLPAACPAPMSMRDFARALDRWVSEGG